MNEILSSEEDGKLGLSKDQLNQKGVNYEQLTSGTLSLQVQSIDAGGHQSSSTTFDLQIPEPPAEDLRPERLQIDSVSLTEGDNLQHTGSHVVPLFLRDRNLDIQSSVIALKDTDQTIELSVPDWLTEVGAFVLRYESGTQVLNKTFSESTDESDLLVIELSPQELSALAFMPTREATGRAPMSLKWTQDFDDVDVPEIELTQPLELRFRDGGDLIPSTLHEDFNSNEPTDTWELYLPQGAKLVDGVSGRRFSLTNGESISAEKLPGWDVMFNNALTKDDLEITAEIQSDNQIKYTLTGSEAAGFVNSLQIINIESEDLASKLLTLRQDPESGSPKVVTASFGIETIDTISLDEHFLQSGSDDEIIDSNKQQNPFIFRTDRNLIIPTSNNLPDGYSIHSITRLDNAGEDDVLDASDVNQLILRLPSIDPNSLNTEDIQNAPNPRTIGIDFHNDSDVIVASQGAFGIDMSEANRVIEVNATGINKINGKTLQEISSELAQANNNNAEEASFEVEANVFNSEGSPEGGSADDNKLYITINDQSASDGIYTPLNGSFIHVLGETFEVGSEDPVNDQLQGLRDALKTGINNLFGSAYGEWVDPMVFEDGRWDHDDHEENDGKHVTFIRFNKDRLNEFQVEELKNALENLYVTKGNSSSISENNNTGQSTESDFDSIKANVFGTGDYGTPEGGSAQNNRSYFTITNESDFNRVYTPVNGSFIHVLGGL